MSKIIIEDAVVRQALESLENLHDGARDYAVINKLDLSTNQTMLTAQENMVSLRSALDNATPYQE